MCSPKASSTIASQHVKWGIESSRRFLGTDWTRDTTVWNRVLDQLTDIPNLKNIHLMGGETLLTDRMEHMIDHFIKRKRFDCSFSFVTNGTVYKPDLMSKLARFSRVGIEVSMETMTDHNQYVRQGTNNDLVRRNIDLFRSWSRDSITVTLRPTISALTIGNVHTLFDYARQEHLLMKSLICNSPAFLDPGILPDQVKALYRTRLQMCLDRLPTATAKDYNFSDPNNVVFVLKDIINMTINLLHKSQPVGSDDRLREMVAHCERWDSAYGLDARSLYPELSELFDRFGYHV